MLVKLIEMLFQLLKMCVYILKTAMDVSMNYAHLNLRITYIYFWTNPLSTNRDNTTIITGFWRLPLVVLSVLCWSKGHLIWSTFNILKTLNKFPESWCKVILREQTVFNINVRISYINYIFKYFWFLLRNLHWISSF